jgi:RNA polymerase sigma factor (sigma-70 family)
VRHRRGVGTCTIEEAYEKWSDHLVRYATALVGPDDAADLVADAFAVLLARGGSAWDEVRDPRGYVFRAVTNAARMHGRSRSRRRGRETTWSVTWSPRPVPPDDGAEPGMRAELLGDPMVTRALGRLSVRQRAVVFLTYWEDLDATEVGSRLGISEGSVKRHLARGRSTLREVLT